MGTLNFLLSFLVDLKLSKKNKVNFIEVYLKWEKKHLKS